MGKKDVITEKEAVISDLEQKISRLKETIESYRVKLKGYSESKIENEIYREIIMVFASSKTNDELYQGVVDLLAKCLKARYSGVFLLDHDKDSFVYRYGKGYKSGLMSGIPRIGSLMGESLFRTENIWEPDLNVKDDYIPLNQDPAEHNVICVPMFLSGDEFGVLRFANIDAEIWSGVGKKVVETVISLFCTIIEQLQEGNRNKQSLKGLKAAFTIARQLENTLDIKDILKNICLHVPKIFECRASIIALVTKEGVKPVMTWPDGYCLGGNPQSCVIYLRNLLEAYPKGEALIKDLHKDRRWAWPKMDIGSLCMVGLFEQKTLLGVIITASRKHEQYTAIQQNLLGLIAAQTSVTMERASYFRKQEKLAARDGLTGLLNHRVFQESVRLEIERAKRYNRLLALVMFDIDHFKKFNDMHGHPVGDKVIKMVASITSAMVRASDMALRYGGAEFCVLLPETSAEKATIFAERLRREIETNRSVQNLAVTISLGITEFKSKDQPQNIIDRADTALYKSKENGRNRISVG